MSKIEELIKQYCPDGVEYKELGEVCGFRNGFAFKSNKFRIKGNPILRIGNIQNWQIDIENLKYFDISDYNENLRPFEIKNGDVIVAMSGATTGKIGMLKSHETFYLNQRVGKFEPILKILNNSFLFHFLLTKSDEIYVMAGGGAQPNLSSTMLMKKIKIPLPPLPVQEEIVNILDKFTSLEAELEAELEARKKQYVYYRDKLLSFEDSVIEWKTFGEIGTFIRGNGLPKSDFSESGIGCIHYGQIYTYYGVYTNETKTFVPETIAKKLTKVNFGDVVITNTSENVEDVCKAVAWLGKEEIVIGGHACVFKHKENPKYLSYYTQTNNFSKEKKKYTKGTKVLDVSSKDLAKIRIPIPPIEEQNRIVAILDKFDALVNDISTGLPAEIKARREQYEYYRGKLLTFN
ncbi:MAG TPA: restriction endonuclease subunit S [Emticicia sp.]